MDPTHESTSAAELDFDAIQIGDAVRTERVFGEEDVARFASLCGDYSPLHTDAAYAAGTEFGGCVVHGMLLASLFSQLVGMRLPGKRCLYLGQDLAFRRPVRIGQPLTATAKVVSKNAGTRTLVLTTEIRDDEDKVVVSGTAKVRVRGELTAQNEAVRTSVTKDGRVALVTGASRGIGAAIARQLGREGYVVAVNFARSEQDAETVAETIRSDGGSAFTIQADVRERTAVNRMTQQVVSEAGGLDALVNGAIGPLHTAPVAEIEWSQFEEHFATQVRGALHTCQAAYPHMKVRGGGSIVNILSEVVCGRPPPQMADYVCAKHALKGLSNALAAEWASGGIRVNTVTPGLVRTQLTDHYQERFFKMEASRVPLRRLAEPEDVALAVAFLLGEGATFLTGVDLPITGGQTMD